MSDDFAEAGLAHHEYVGVGDEAFVVDLERIPAQRSLTGGQVGPEEWTDRWQRRLDGGRVQRAHVGRRRPMTQNAESPSARRGGTGSCS